MTRAGPSWLQLVWTALFGATLALAFTVLGFVIWADSVAAWLDAGRWGHWFSKNLVVSLTIAYLTHALFELGARWVGGPARIRRFSMPQRLGFFAGIPLLGLALGWPLGFRLAGGYNKAFFGTPTGARTIVASVAVSLLICAVLYQWFGAKARALDAERRASEAQLRLLQAQIEPHFLFNTLANVQALIEHDAPKAKRMLGAFTDYLRAGLSGLRRAEAPLADELALAEAYLRVQQSRMEGRLVFSIEADAAAARAALPPLLLQPLVENAVQHGLEPQVDGGRIDVRARVDGIRLVIDVRDDGLGLGDAHGAGRAGAGLALANVRERLAAQFGDAASLELEPAAPGTLARLTLPLKSPAETA